MQTKRVKWAAVAMVAGLALSACGEDDPVASDTTEAPGGTTGDATGETTGEPSGEAGTSEGEISITGSSTVAPISALVADEFNAAGSPATISVDDPGTGDGFALFCEGGADISDASRPIKQEEADACEAAGVEFVEIEVAFDGLTVMTNPANDAVECLTTADLYALVGPESEGFANWSDGQEIATALGSATELPDVPLDITAPGTESGTYDAFIELALGDGAEARIESGDITEDDAGTRSDYSSQADDNAIISGIEGSDTSFGWVGFAFAEGAGDAIKEIAVDGGDGCIEPSIETIADGSYPLSRSLYIYVNAANAEENSALAEYVDFYVQSSSLTDLVSQAGYVPLPDDRATAATERWTARTPGSDLLG
ncbi:MAG: substrate-binding domain-containing protein [Acidimicrobiia bacterium]|nr:substrate-binding domain-containing protein [Acidimicrobiia bacterium]